MLVFINYWIEKCTVKHWNKYCGFVNCKIWSKESIEVLLETEYLWHRPVRFRFERSFIKNPKPFSLWGPKRTVTQPGSAIEIGLWTAKRCCNILTREKSGTGGGVGGGLDDHHDQSWTNIYNTRNAIKINTIRNVGNGVRHVLQPPCNINAITLKYTAPAVVSILSL